MTRTDMLVRILGRSGLLGLRARQVRRGDYGSLPVLAYHRVGGPVGDDYPFDPQTLSCSAVEFAREMDFVKAHFEVIGCDQLAGGGWEDLERPLVITFDDGYRDNVETALPILGERNLKAVFFVTTAYMRGDEIPWWDAVHYAIQQGSLLRSFDFARSYGGQAGFPPSPLGGYGAARRVPSFAPSTSLGATEGKQVPGKSVDGLGERRRRAEEEIGRLKRMTDVERRARLKELLGESMKDISAERLMMNWDDVRKLVAAGMEIGSHTVTHPVLATMDDEGVRRELAESKREIEAEIGRPVCAVSYPVGGERAVDERVVRIAKECGYKVGCTYQHGVNLPGADLMTLRRIHAEVGENFDRFRAKILFPQWVRY